MVSNVSSHYISHAFAAGQSFSIPHTNTHQLYNNRYFPLSFLISFVKSTRSIRYRPPILSLHIQKHYSTKSPTV
jgi:hypothetical protein